MLISFKCEMKMEIYEDGGLMSNNLLISKFIG